jgi:hypothetical protein
VLLWCVFHSAFSFDRPVELTVNVFFQRMNERAIVAGTTGQGLDQALDEVVDSVATPVGASSDGILGGNVGNGLNTALKNILGNVANSKRAIVAGVRLSPFSSPSSPRHSGVPPSGLHLSALSLTLYSSVSADHR